MQRMEGNKGSFVIKVNLSKEYDKLNLDFIWRTISEINLLEKLINIIMHYITSVETNVKWHGVMSDFCRP